MTHVYRQRRSAGAVALAILASALLSLAACGGGGDDDDSLPSVADVAPELADFGDLATLHSQPVSETFGPDGGELTLADGARVEVPEGAFPEPTELTAVIVDIDPGDLLESMRVYVLSTAAEVGALPTPVVLEVQRPADEVFVAKLVDGEWQVVEVPPGPTTKVEITHFSTERTVVWGCVLFLGGGEPVTDPDDPRLFAFTICLQQTAGAFGFDLPTAPAITGEDQAFITNLVNDIANELERADASNEDIAAAKAEARTCLTAKLLAGETHEAAAGACDPTFPQPDPEPDPGSQPDPADPGTGTEPDPADPGTGTEPGPADPGTGTEPGPEPTQTPAGPLGTAKLTWSTPDVSLHLAIYPCPEDPGGCTYGPGWQIGPGPGCGDLGNKSAQIDIEPGGPQTRWVWVLLFTCPGAPDEITFKVSVSAAGSLNEVITFNRFNDGTDIFVGSFQAY